MPNFLIQASLHKWPGSFDDQAVRIEISEKAEAANVHEAWRKLDKLIADKKAQLDKEGFRSRIIWSEVKGV